ncbi:MAG: hypothetical protein ABIA04_11205 [Pseudomonadota bacterium]
MDCVGFNVLKGESENGTFEQINTSLIPSQGDLNGSYSFTDNSIKDNTDYYYEIETVNYDGSSITYDPVLASTENEGSLKTSASCASITSTISNTPSSKQDLGFLGLLLLSVLSFKGILRKKRYMQPRKYM